MRMSQSDSIEDGYQPRRIFEKADRLIVISGCSGGGKSTLLAELGHRGLQVFEEPGRQVVKEQLAIGGDALPWANVAQFVELTVSRSMHHMVIAARSDRLSFFDRGIIDQIAGLRHLNLPIPHHLLMAAECCRYHEEAFMVPPWPENFANDTERRHSLDEAVASYETLLGTYARFGYRAVIVPKLAVAARAEFVVGMMKESALTPTTPRT
jgi:predicted ATPase